MTKDSCKNGNKVFYNQLFKNKAKKRENHEKALTQEATEINRCPSNNC